ncbi:hypothetical protein [Ruegeria atlantica]|uniref:hypothetical protein n=1 Tax=Ruegeria atlantica TaxID=81569 RepID=UPI00071E35FF|nr:hypothetical protein [Ruegeria atlantica]
MSALGCDLPNAPATPSWSGNDGSGLVQPLVRAAENGGGEPILTNTARRIDGCFTGNAVI